MYSKEEVKEIKTAFFEAFKQKMGKHRSIGGFRVNWINYPLRLKNFYCRIILEPDHYGLVVDIQEKDESMRQLYAEQWEELKKVLSDQMGNSVKIEPHYEMFTGIKAVRVELFMKNGNWQQQDHWSTIHQDLKENLKNFDAFWQDFDDVFKGLLNR